MNVFDRLKKAREEVFTFESKGAIDEAVSVISYLYHKVEELSVKSAELKARTKNAEDMARQLRIRRGKSEASKRTEH